jgi:oxalate decarboxylase
MKLFRIFSSSLLISSALAGLVGRQTAQNSFEQGSPRTNNGSRGSIISGTDTVRSADPLLTTSGGTNHDLDLQNPDGLGQQTTDAGTVPNLKWSFSLSKTRIFPGGWTRTQVIQDLPQSHDIAAAQQHLKKGAVRELHWHKVAEWGFVYTGRVTVSAVDENGQYQVEELGVGDIWYFPKGQAHAIQGLEDENEYLLTFDEGNFDAVG